MSYVLGCDAKLSLRLESQQVYAHNSVVGLYDIRKVSVESWLC